MQVILSTPVVMFMYNWKQAAQWLKLQEIL